MGRDSEDVVLTREQLRDIALIDEVWDDGRAWYLAELEAGREPTPAELERRCKRTIDRRVKGYGGLQMNRYEYEPVTGLVVLKLVNWMLSFMENDHVAFPTEIQIKQKLEAIVIDVMKTTTPPTDAPALQWMPLQALILACMKAYEALRADDEWHTLLNEKTKEALKDIWAIAAPMKDAMEVEGVVASTLSVKQVKEQLVQATEPFRES